MIYIIYLLTLGDTKKRKNVPTIKTCTPSKNSDLHTTSALDTEVKNGQIWHKALNK